MLDSLAASSTIVIVDMTKKNKITLDSANRVVKPESDGDIEVISKANVIMHSNALKIGASEGVIGKGASLLTHAAVRIVIEKSTTLSSRRRSSPGGRESASYPNFGEHSRSLSQSACQRR